MRLLVLILTAALLQACGTDIASQGKADQSTANQAQRDQVQESRIDNPAALACLEANMTEEEWAVLGREDEEAEWLLAEVLARQGTQQCFEDNRIVIYL